jgi:hypothetical protein
MNGPISNFNNRITFAPTSWFTFLMGSQVPIGSDGFTELNTDLNFMPCRSLEFGFGTRYIDNYGGSQNDNQYPIHLFWRANDHWSFSAQEIYNTTPAQNSQAAQNSIIYQRYMINRDLSSWVFSFGAEVRNNQSQGNQAGGNQYGALISFTLKDLPQVNLPFAFSGASQAGSSPIAAGQ